MNKLDKLSSKYDKCRTLTNNTKLFCGASSVIPTMAEQAVDQVGSTLMLGGGKMVISGVGGSVSTGGASVPLVIGGGAIAAAGYYTTLKSEKITLACRSCHSHPCGHGSASIAPSGG